MLPVEGELHSGPQIVHTFLESRSKWGLAAEGWTGSAPVEACRMSSALYSTENMAQEKRKEEEERTDLLQ